MAASEDIVPAERLYDWGSYCGVPGGIPVRTTVYTTLGPGATASQISAAIASCPSGQVVQLSAGTYNLGSGQIVFPYTRSGVTLRGAGAGKTIITGSAFNVISNTYRYFLGDNGIPVAGGYQKGSRAITLASAPAAAMTAGNLIVITEDQSPNKFAPGIGTYTRDGLSSGLYSNVSASRCFRYLTRITGVSGNTINLASPLPLDFSGSLNVRAYPQNGSGVMSLCGVEDLTLYGCADPIRWYQTDRCWVKGVEFSHCTYGDVGNLQLNSSFQIEVRNCYFHDVAGYPNQSDGIAVGVNYGVCNGLFIDNIAYRTSAMFEINGAAANAFLYNFAYDTARAGNQVACPFPFIYHHGPHTMANLFEGNVGDNYLNDGYHGSGSHAVLFRNHFNGLHPSYTLYRRLIALPRGSYYHSVVGNVLGDPSWTPNRYVGVAGDASTVSHVYLLGFPNGNSASVNPETSWSTHPNVYPDPAVASTLIRHGNYDYYNRSVVWDGAIASRSLPSSLFYGSKPAFFGSLSWPAIGPDVGGLVTSIPAKARWDSYLSSGNLDGLTK